MILQPGSECKEQKTITGEKGNCIIIRSVLLQIALNTWFCLKDLKTLLKVLHLQSARKLFPIPSFPESISNGSSPSQSQSDGPSRVRYHLTVVKVGGGRSEWGDREWQRLETVGRAQSCCFCSIIISKTHFTYMQRLETRDVPNAGLVFTVTNDLNYPSPLRGQRWLQPNKKICPFSSASLFPAPDRTT